MPKRPPKGIDPQGPTKDVAIGILLIILALCVSFVALNTYQP